MRSREEMLAEGPRVAPDARTIDVWPEPRTFDSITADGAVVMRSPGGVPRRRSPAWAGKLAAPAIVAIVVLAQVAGQAGFAEALFVGAFFVIGLLNVLRGKGDQ